MMPAWWKSGGKADMCIIGLLIVSYAGSGRRFSAWVGIAWLR